MQTYDSVREHCTAALKVTGELDALNAEERAILEKGSLDVFFARRLASMELKQRVLNRVAGIYYALVFGYLAVAVLDHFDLIAPHAWPVIGALIGGLRPVVWVLGGSIVFVSGCHLVYLAIERRQKLYGELDETRARFNQTL